MKLCIVFAMLAVLPGLGRAEDASEDFRLVDASGPVAVFPAGSDEPFAATPGLPLSAGDRIETGDGGSAELAAKSGTVIRLDGNASLGLEDARSGWTTFRLHVGRFLGKFQKSLKSRYSVKTPVAVASVRGTEFVLDVAENGDLDAGVVEGEVALAPAADAPAGPASGWSEEVLTASQGLEVRALERPRRLSEIPRPLVRSLDWFPRARARVKGLRDTWKDLDPPARRALRQQSLRERVKWNAPPRPGAVSPRNRVRPRSVPRRLPQRRGRSPQQKTR